MLSGKRSEFEEFQDWLAARQKHFDEVNASPADIADIARRDGFSQSLLSQWLQHKRWESLGKAS